MNKPPMIANGLHSKARLAGTAFLLLVPCLVFAAGSDKPSYSPITGTGTDILAAKNLVIQTAQEEMHAHSDDLRAVMQAFYRHNPGELRKSTSVSAEEMVQWVFEGPFGWKFESIRRVRKTDALNLCLSPEFQGDRVLALITGLQTMLISAYGGETEFHFPHPINPQYLYLAARNIEITLRKLKHPGREQDGLDLAGDGTDPGIETTLTALARRVDLHAMHFASQAGTPLRHADADTASFVGF
ncbi:hypothetical protein MTYP_02674 [Methylophilaceae bacterium]|nr:hypothetical protein MTYP_02674 [Methylophilaceae bacterium]